MALRLYPSSAAFQSLFSAGKYPLLDSLRGLAALMVLFSHTWRNHDWGILNPVILPLGNYSGHGGVELFFLLSGFLITLPFFQRWMARAEMPNLHGYIRNRILRVLPLYYFTSTIFLLVYFRNAPYDLEFFRTVFSYLLLTMNFFSELNQVNSPTWSVAVELHFYLLVPLLFLAAWQMRRLWLLLLGILALVLAYRYVIISNMVGQPVSTGNFRDLIYANSFSRLHDFAFGAGISWLVAARPALKPSRSKQSYLLLAAAAALIVTAITYENVALNAADTSVNLGQHLFALTLSCTGWAIVLWLSVRQQPLLVRVLQAPLGWNWLAFVGRISFSVYLWHMPVYGMLEKRLSPILGEWVFVSLFTAGIVVLATVSYLYIEYPFLSRKSKPAPQRAVVQGGLAT